MLVPRVGAAVTTYMWSASWGIQTCGHSLGSSLGRPAAGIRDRAVSYNSRSDSGFAVGPRSEQCLLRIVCRDRPTRMVDEMHLSSAPTVFSLAAIIGGTVLLGACNIKIDNIDEVQPPPPALSASGPYESLVGVEMGRERLVCPAASRSVPRWPMRLAPARGASRARTGMSVLRRRTAP
jgi:hypothetical protein